MSIMRWMRKRMKSGWCGAAGAVRLVRCSWCGALVRCAGAVRWCGVAGAA